MLAIITGAMADAVHKFMQDRHTGRYLEVVIGTYMNLRLHGQIGGLRILPHAEIQGTG